MRGCECPGCAAHRRELEARIRADEREACAKIVEPGSFESQVSDAPIAGMRRFLAAAIRARGGGK